MEKLKIYGSLLLGIVYVYDFLHTLFSDAVGTYEVIGMEVSRITYLAYLFAIALAFISYGISKQFERQPESNRESV